MFKENQKNDNKIQAYAGYLLLALTFLIAIRLLPSLKAPLANYGYDFGFYFHAAKTAGWSLNNLGQIIGGGYNSFIFLLGRLVHLPANITVIDSYFLASVFFGLSFYLLLQKFGKITGIFAVLLVACSLFQAEAYSMFLWKNVLALPFFILALKFLIAKNYKAFIISSLLVLLLHRTTTIVLVVTSTVYFFWLLLEAKKIKQLVIYLVAMTVIFLLVLFIPSIQLAVHSLLNNQNSYVTSGIFLENQKLLPIWWPYLALAIPGLILYLKYRQDMLLPVFTGICFIWIIFGLPFAHRGLIYLDISAIYFSAYFLGQINYSRTIFQISGLIVFLFLFYRTTQFILNKQPLISQADATEIKNFNRPTGFILAVSANDAPWLLAYARNQRLGTPGLLEDPHTYQDWISFWQGQNQRTFLSFYPRPLYLYQRTWQLSNGQALKCLIKLTENFYQLNYDCIEKSP